MDKVTEMELDLKTAIQIAKIVAAAPEERMPLIWDIFHKAGVDIDGLDELAEWKAMTKTAFLIDTEKFLEEITSNRGTVSNEYQIPANEFNEYCARQKLSARSTRKHLASIGAIRVQLKPKGTPEYTPTVWRNNAPCRCVCIYTDWRDRIRGFKTKEGPECNTKN